MNRTAQDRLAAGQVQGDVGDHVFLATNKASRADLEEDVASVQPEYPGSCLGVP